MTGTSSRLPLVGAAVAQDNPPGSISGTPGSSLRRFISFRVARSAGMAGARSVAGGGAVHVGIRATGDGEGHVGTKFKNLF